VSSLLRNSSTTSDGMVISNPPEVWGSAKTAESVQNGSFLRTVDGTRA